MVRRILVVPGQRVAAGDLLLVLDAMTLEHPVHAPGAGVVTEIPVSAGGQVQTGAVLAVIAPELDPWRAASGLRSEATREGGA
jgi:propionyl-CoA carboxylase alpha chain